MADTPSQRILTHRRLIVVALITLSAVLLAGAVWIVVRRSPDPAHPPRIVYLAPADSAARHLYLADLDGGEAQPLTRAEAGIEDFAVSPDGKQIAYSQSGPEGTIDLWLLDLDSGESRPLTRCVRAICTDPAWNPDGTQILYQRQEFSTGQDNASWVWIVDVNTVETRLLFDDDPQIRGADPVWSPDGRRVAVFDGQLQAIRVRDLETGTDTFISSEPGASGTFSPDGSQLVYPVLVRGAIGQEFYTHLDMVDFETQASTPISGEIDAPVDDAFAAWSPDGTKLALARRYLDTRYTEGKQVYLLDLETGTVAPLVVDPAYNHAGIRWDSSGQRIVFQRFSLAETGSQPEVWVYDLTTGELALIAGNAFFPAWLPETGGLTR